MFQNFPKVESYFFTNGKGIWSYSFKIISILSMDKIEQKQHQDKSGWTLMSSMLFFIHFVHKKM